jgi:cyclophilin family peptidyl-prolyl cis-trans isomerase
VTGTVFIDPGSNNSFVPGDTVVPGASVTLTGTTTNSTKVDVTTTTDANGNFTFFQVQPGTYSLSRGSDSNFLAGKGSIGSLGGTIGINSISSITVAEGQTGINYNLSTAGLSPGVISLRDFLASFTAASDVTFARTGPGFTAADNTVQPSTAPSPGTSILSGAVKNGSTGLPGVEVTLSGIDNTGQAIFQTTTTIAGNTGFYQFTALNPLVYTLNVPTQPAGFRADLPTVGALGGLVLRNDQITNITVGTGVIGGGYNFAELALLTPTKHAGPVIAAELADNTAGPGGTTSDNTTSDPSIVGSATSSSGPITDLTARFTGAFVDITSQLGADGRFFLNAALLKQINGGSLPDGSYALHLQATDSAGNVRTFDVLPAFALNTTPPTIPTLQIQSGPNNDNTATVGGTTSPGATVVLQQGSPTVASVSQNAVNVTFQFPGPQNQMGIDFSGLTGTGPPAAVSTPVTGALPTTAEIQTISFGGTVTGGTFTLSFKNTANQTMTTGPITWSANSASLVANIQAALNNIIGNQTTTAVAGKFSFNITMTPGPTKFNVQAVDKAGNISQLTQFLVNPIKLTNPAGQTVNMTAPSVSTDTSKDQNIDLTGVFTDANLANSVVTFNTSAGPINMQLLDGATPQTVANFLNYVSQGSYNNDIFQRNGTTQSPPLNVPVLQGGGFTFQTNPSNLVPVETNPEIQNEFNASHPDALGTIAMAKGSDPNSATSQFFLNLADNSSTLGSSNTGGFTVFGQVQSGADQRILNTLAAFPVANETQTVFNVTFTTPGPMPTMTPTSILAGTMPTINVATTTPGSIPSTTAIQTITFGGTITGGKFTLTLGSATTGDINWSSDNATLATNIQTALNALANTNVTVAPGTNPFSAIPLKNFTGSQFPISTTASNFALINNISTQVAPTDHLTFQVTGNTVSSVADASVNANNWLLLHPKSAGSTVITVTVSDGFNSSAMFQVTVNVT